ncbi:phytoene/squalene synthase family protein [Sediminibacterium sp.]|uniref:phytoene/squalene synthase family protein n=1 Tax=Sediminibacterium sp. TaxID=1917865 RepID=UPI0027365DA6|nr:phytoene/squalene synthase family protein [Sediminibacterium sp.]MDP3567492.1 phytoene/squalene synthase family protein [Sediminibacterium sp.]
MKALFDQVSYKTSKMVTRQYSTSFSLGIRFLNKDFHKSIYAIYGFVRFADEIVDSFHDYDKKQLLDEFKRDTYLSIERGISLNPILNSFQEAINKYKIDNVLIESFLKSMTMDLEKKVYTEEDYKEYILGSAEVVGLMCLCVFTEGDKNAYKQLKPYAMALGSAFQKINFLRDLNADYVGLGRNYFPNLSLSELNEKSKVEIEKDIQLDFDKGLQGIKMLPKKSRLGVYVAYIYYISLFNKIKKLNHKNILESRVRIPNSQKMVLFAGSYVRNGLNML